MKKYILLTSFLVIAFSTSNFAKPWWQIVLADIAGGCTGYGNGGIIGAIGGAAGASATFAAKIGQSSSGNYNGRVVTNPLNNFDNVGVTHNKILVDYFKSKTPRNNINLTSDFIVERVRSYGFQTKSNDNKAVLEISKKIMETNLTTSDDMIKYLGRQIPNSIKDKFKKSLDKILATTSIAELNKIILAEENQFIEDKTLDKNSKDTLKCFFSVLRHSAAFWAE